MARNNIGIRIPFTDYSMAYTYDPAWGRHYHLKDVAETHYRTEGTPTDADNVLSTHSYGYDPNGNLSSESVARKRYDNSSTQLISERKLSWDTQNRLRAISENGYVSLYWYDADGNRTVKEHLGGEAVWVNGAPAGVNTDTLTYTIYPNPYITINGNRWTKHYYVGSERIASRTGTISSFGDLNIPDSHAAGASLGISISYGGKKQMEEDSIASMYSQLGVPYEVQRTRSCDAGCFLYLPASQGGGDAASGDAGSDRQRSHPNTLGDGAVYFYTRDHLGSTLTVTDSVGATVQRVEYTPWGEVFVELKPGSSGYETPYLFNGKELDDETGLYYYGARYYDPKLSVWYGVDPLSNYNPLGHDNHIDGKHNGGIFNQGNLNPYIYCYNNSVKYLDPNGEQVVAVHGTWSDNNTWEDKQGISRYAAIKFGNTSFNFEFKWSGGNFSSYRYDAADQLIKHIRLIRIGLEQTEPITLVGHSHGGNVCIEAINKMVLMHEFDDIKIYLLTINTPVRKDHQLSYEAQKRVRHINVFDPFDPVQVMGGNLFELTPILKKESPEKPYGEFGPAKRKFKNADNIEVNNPQNAFHDFHNSHNRVKDWENK